MGVGPEREEGELGCLLRGGLGELGATVPGLYDEQAGQPVDVLVAVESQMCTPSPRTIVGTWWVSYVEWRVKCIQRWSLAACWRASSDGWIVHRFGHLGVLDSGLPSLPRERRDGKRFKGVE